MKTFHNLDDLWIDAIHHIETEGSVLPSRDGSTYEYLGYVARLANPMNNFMFNPVRKMSPHYAAAELIWFLSGQRTISRISKYAPQYARFCNEAELHVDSHGCEYADMVSHANLSDQEIATKFQKTKVLYAHGAYGYRMARTFDGYTAVASIIRMLKTDPNTRQAVLALYDAGLDLAKATSGDKKDIPCTLTLNFILRDGKLNLFANMRSNDVWLGLPHDIWCFTCIQRLIAEAVGVGIGWYQHGAMSLHLYDRNRDKAIEAWNDPHPRYTDLVYCPHNMNISDAARSVVIAERMMTNGYTPSPHIDLPEDSLLGQVYAMVAHKWAADKQNWLERISNPAMSVYMRSNWC